MRSSPSRLFTTFFIGLCVAAACTSASNPGTATPGAPTPTATPGAPTPTATPAFTPPPTPVPVPTKPTAVRFDEQARVSTDGQVGEVTQTVSWRAPRTDGVEIRVFGVLECIAAPTNPSPGTSGPCLVVQTPLPASLRTLLARAPASDGVVSWSWTEDPGCRIGLAFDPDGPAYHAVVVAAYSESGHSIFAIAEPGRWWRPGLDDIVC